MISFIQNYWTSVIEIGILAAVLYLIYHYLGGTQGARILIRLTLIFVALTLFSQFLHLTVVEWLLRSLSGFLALALVIIFQPELRRVVTEIGNNHLFSNAFEKRETIEELTDTVFELSAKGFGALIAIEREIGLRSVAETGVSINCTYSKELVLTIFQPKTVLHDGGVILCKDHIIAAACIFPVTQREDLDRNLGLRHRAALGLTEITDGVTIVVSEETGQVSICHNGIIERNLNADKFQNKLNQLLLFETYEKPTSA